MGRLRRKAIYEAMPFSGPHGFLTGGCEATSMFRIVAVALAAMAAFDLLYLNGKHLHAVMAMLTH
ncbi:MAG: hypothetical protein ACLQFW_12875 [Xanthobacteraceae bacterium]